MIFAVVIVAILIAGFIVVLTTPPSGVSVQGSWTDNTVLGSGTLHYEGTVFNHYNSTVHSVKLELWLYDSNNHMMQIETVELGDIPAQSSKVVNFDISHSGIGVSRVDKVLTWNP